MQNDNPRRLTFDFDLLQPGRQNLLSDIAAQASSLGMPCYLVGGFVRDLILQKPVNDLDVIVEGNAVRLGDGLVKKYGGKLTVHPKFATAIWDAPKFDAIDLITARSETYEHAGALPAIKPSNIDDDLRRRDFTINALALRLDGDHSGEVIDPLGGQDDLARGIIRVLHPRSFVDDPTRIFRAVRYEQRYGFKIDDETLSLINQESLGVLSTLSGERIRHEIDLIFEEQSAALILSRLKELRVLDTFNLPGFEHAALLDSHPPAEFNLSVDRVLLGYLLWLMDSPVEYIASISTRLDFTADLGGSLLAVAQLKKDLPNFQNAKPSAWTFYLEKFPLSSVYALWLAANISALKEFLVKWRHIKAAVTGNDLKARGIPPGPKYKEILTRLRAARLDGNVKTAKEEQELLNTLP
jgi:tRNA nucleotidyltransferase (CCA-adding enzyme)